MSKFDLSKDYWQLPLGQSSKEITAFQTPMGLYQFSVMPFGLVNPKGCNVLITLFTMSLFLLVRLFTETSCCEPYC